MRLFLIGTLVFGAVPCGIGALLCLLGLANLIESYLVPSTLFGRRAFSSYDVVLILIFLSGAIGGLACVAAWLKAWKRLDEKNRYLLGGLLLGLGALLATNAAIIQAREYTWLIGSLPPVGVVPVFLWREWRQRPRGGSTNDSPGLEIQSRR